MTKPLRLDREAEEELAEAVSWYQERAPVLARRFVLAIRRAFERIAEHPAAWPPARHVPPALGARACWLRRFPYAVVYLELDDMVRVLSIMHGKRAPAYWQSRVR